MFFKTGELMAENLKKMKIEIVPVLEDLKKIEILDTGVKFNFSDKIKESLKALSDDKELLKFQKVQKEVYGKPLRVGIIFSGGPASGGHNVIAGLYDAVKNINFQSEVIGFFDGPEGLLNGNGRELKEEEINNVRNQGGFYLLGTSRTKFESEEDFENCFKTIQKFKLDGIVIVGGDDSNTNAAFLANYLKLKKCSASVIGIPKTIDGDLAFLPYLETSFGFHTATRIYSEMVGNICRDLPSSRKIWHFVKLMGRSASWITLEVAFQTQPNVALIGEEIKSKKMSLNQVIDYICEIIAKRYVAGKKYGIVLIPEGIVEFIPEIKELIAEINKSIVRIGNENFLKMTLEERREKILVELEGEKEQLFVSLPKEVQNGLLSGLDPHGNVQVSQIASDVLLMELCKEKLSKSGIEINGKTHKIKISTQTHFYGYDGRCGYPTLFDATYTYNLGRVAGALVVSGKSGYMAVINNLFEDVEKWEVQAVPLCAMMSVEERKGKESLVIKKYLVDLESPAFQEFEKNRKSWALNDDYLCPGPIQFFGPKELINLKATTLFLNSKK